jgi:hypothetical protein
MLYVKCASWLDDTIVGFQLGFLLLALIWKFDFSPFMVLIIAILNDGMFPSTARIIIFRILLIAPVQRCYPMFDETLEVDH